MRPVDAPILRSLILRALNAGEILRVNKRSDRRIPPTPKACDNCHRVRFKTLEKKSGIRIRVQCRVEAGGCGQVWPA